MKVVRTSHYYDQEIGENIVLAIFKAEAEDEKDIRGAVRPNADGSYTIFVNEILSESQAVKTLRHERTHIISGDFDANKRGSNVQTIETIAHSNSDKTEAKSVGLEYAEKVIRSLKRSIAKQRRELERKRKEEEEYNKLLENLGIYREYVEVQDEFGRPVMKWVER